MNNPGLLPSSFLEKIVKEDRPEGSAGWTSLESQERGGRREEIKEQKEFARWLKFKGIIFYNPRTDKKSTIMEGAADFSIFHNKTTLFIEFKALGQKLSPEQIKFSSAVYDQGFSYVIAFSHMEAIELCRKLLKL